MCVRFTGGEHSNFRTAEMSGPFNNPLPRKTLSKETPSAHTGKWCSFTSTVSHDFKGSVEVVGGRAFLTDMSVEGRAL